MKIKSIYKALFVMMVALGCGNSVKAQGFVIKSNLLCDLSGSFSLGAEYPLTEKSSLSLMANYNPWEFEDNAKRKYMLIQPEYRKWVRGVYDGYFWGIQLNYATFNIGGSLPWWIDSFDTFENNRYQGDLYGMGATTGYQWILSPRLNLEVAASLGYAHICYDKYDRPEGTPRIEQGIHNYWGITQIGLTLVYYIK
ncbi:MAG: DUF3575 domain-containing protein [Rikenellaceae bacterium]